MICIGAEQSRKKQKLELSMLFVSAAIVQKYHLSTQELRMDMFRNMLLGDIHFAVQSSLSRHGIQFDT